jgi:hypothetical protein
MPKKHRSSTRKPKPKVRTRIKSRATTKAPMPDGPTIHDALEAEESLAHSALEPSLPLGDEASLDRLDPDTEAEVEEILHDTQTAVDESTNMAGPSRADVAREVALAGGDVDAASDQPGGSDESVGGSTPTPDQDVVDELGRAAGVTYAADEPLRPEEKEAERDDDRWELDPASAEDYEERMREQRRPSRPRPH